MLELHSYPNSPWYARQLPDGKIELNPGVSNAEGMLLANHPTLHAAMMADRRVRNALREARRLLIRVLMEEYVSNAALNDAIGKINDVEPDKAE